MVLFHINHKQIIYQTNYPHKGCKNLVKTAKLILTDEIK